MDHAGSAKLALLAKTVKLLTVIAEDTLVQAVHCERLFERVASEGWCRRMLQIVLLVARTIPGPNCILLCIFTTGDLLFGSDVLAFFETLDAFPTGRSIIFSLDLLDSLVCFGGLEFGVPVAGK